MRGDLLYGADPVLAARLGLTRQWLHAVSLTFAHPADGRESPSPATTPPTWPAPWTSCAPKADDMEIAEHIDMLRRQGSLLADAAERAGLDTAVPPARPGRSGTCCGIPDSSTGGRPGTSRSAPARSSTGRRRRRSSVAARPTPSCSPGSAPDTPRWRDPGHRRSRPGVRDLHGRTVRAGVLGSAQAHETAMHRADAESAAGAMPSPRRNSPPRHRRADHGFGRRPDPGRRRPTAGGCACWPRTPATPGLRRTRAHATRRDRRRRGGRPGCTVSGPASGVYLYLWNRADAAQAGVTVTGDPGLLTGLAVQRPGPLGLTNHKATRDPVCLPAGVAVHRQADVSSC